ncbi:hypothetical protein ACJMK2_008254 [Sinanodonta woodiana]|uniref:Uncharacterized protein n=1 Tax=Sinanodonta woodiana TaxID=1069815 RepID=A0ABD3VL92_SINWO
MGVWLGCYDRKNIKIKAELKSSHKIRYANVRVQFVPDYDEEIEEPQLKRPRWINKDVIIRISRASSTFTLPRAVDEPSFHIPTMPKDQNQNLPMTRCTMMKTPSVAEEAPEALDLSQKNSSPLPIQGTDSNISKK